MSVYRFSARTITGEEKSLSDYEGRVLLIVNTASRCGFTPQYRELQELYETYRDRGLEILAFPCNQFANQEPGSEEEIQKFCETQYNVTFPLFSKVKVKGPDAHPLFKYLTESAPGDARQGNQMELHQIPGEPARRSGQAVRPADIPPADRQGYRRMAGKTVNPRPRRHASTAQPHRGRRPAVLRPSQGAMPAPDE